MTYAICDISKCRCRGMEKWSGVKRIARNDSENVKNMCARTRNIYLLLRFVSQPIDGFIAVIEKELHYYKKKKEPTLRAIVVISRRN